jgi:hypothetical protein
MNIPNYGSNEDVEDEVDDVEVDANLSEKIDKILNETDMFNKSNVDMVNIYFFYCINKSLDEYTKIVLPLKLGNLSKDDLHLHILKHRMYGGRRYNVSGIYAYQFDTDIKEFLKNNECDVKEHKQLGDIKFDPMVELFQHYSSIFIVFNNEKTKHTRKKNEKNDNEKNIDKGVPKRKSKTAKVA